MSEQLLSNLFDPTIIKQVDLYLDRLAPEPWSQHLDHTMN